MAAFADLSLPDGGTTPTPRTFAARHNDGIVQVWRYSPDTNFINDRTLTARIFPPKNAGGDYKVHITIEVPLVDAPAPSAGYQPAPRQVATTKMQIICFLPSRSNLADRQNARAWLAAALASSQIKDLLELYSPPRG